MFQGLSLAAAAVSFALCVHAWRRRTAAPGAGAFALLMAAASLWALTAFLQRFESEAPRRLFWLFVGSPGVFVVPPAWLLFAMLFTGREARARAWARALFVLPLLSVLAVLCDVLGIGPGLYLRAVSQPTGPDGVLDLRLTPGPWYWVNITYSYLCLAAGSVLLMPHAVGVALRAEDGAGFVLVTPDGETEWPDIGRGFVGRALRTGLVQRVADVLSDPDYVVLWRDTRSELAMPVRHGERVLGVLNFESERIGAFDDEDLRMAESLAGALGLALAKAMLYRDLERQHQKLRQAERLRDDLTHALVHDIKSPLTTVLGSLGFLEDKLREGATADPRLVEMALRGGTRIRELVDGLLDVGRLEAGQMPLDLRAHEVAPLIAEALRLQAPLAEKRGIAVEARLPAQPLHAVLDAELFARVLQNLVGNALKFTPQGGTVWVAAQPRDGRAVEIEVGDTGPGIAAELRPRLFQKFAAAGPGHGTGLGLAFCRLAIEAHEGTLELRRREGAGAVFAFTLRGAMLDSRA